MQGYTSTKGKTILIANYHMPYPPRDGADNRCVEIIQAFQTLGFEVVLFSSDLFQQTPWTKMAVKQIEDELKIQVILYLANTIEKQNSSSAKLQWYEYVTPSLKNYFKIVYKAIEPDIVLINYAFWGDLAVHKKIKKSVCIIDAIDILSLNQKMADITTEHLNKGKINEPFIYAIDGANEEVLQEDFFNNKHTFSADTREFKIYDKFDITIAINSKEKETIQNNTCFTKNIYIPFSFSINRNHNTYTEPPLFVIGPNQFNFQGYLYFVKRILPVIHQQEPDFVLEVMGDGCKYLTETRGVKLLGFVQNKSEKYSRSKFAICPLIGATGQQLKVMEAMANGLPVIALSNVAERCPIIHNINGLIAENATEFANYTLKLFNDPDLCFKLGQAAKDTIDNEFNKQKIIDTLASSISNLAKPGIVKSKTRKIFWSLIFYLTKKYRLFKQKINRKMETMLTKWKNRTKFISEKYYFIVKLLVRKDL